MFWRITFVVSCLMMAHAAHVYGDEKGPHPDVPELKELGRLVGNWTGEAANGTSSKSTIVWTLGGRFVKQEYTSSDGSSGMIMRGFSPSLGKYVMTLFDTNGSALMLTGDWNAANKSLTCSGDLGNGVNIAVRSEFPDDDTETWTITVKQGGSIAGELTGTNRRIRD